jgi:hypothetical protein
VIGTVVFIAKILDELLFASYTGVIRRHRADRSNTDLAVTPHP